jgi:hypothetical protein
MPKPMLRASSLRRTPVGTLMMTEFTSGLNMKRHEGRRKKDHKHE